MAKPMGLLAFVALIKQHQKIKQQRKRRKKQRTSISSITNTSFLTPIKTSTPIPRRKTLPMEIESTCSVQKFNVNCLGISRFKLLIETDDDAKFRELTNITIAQFKTLLNLIEQKKIVTYKANMLTAQSRLLLTLSYLAQRVSAKTLSIVYNIGKTTASTIIKETAVILQQVLWGDYMKRPIEEDFVRISRNLATKYHFPHCAGILDGKTLKSGISVFTICNDKQKIIYYEVTSVESGKQQSLLKELKFCKEIESNTFNFPHPSVIPEMGKTIKIPYFFVTDAKFPLSPFTMPPFSMSHQTKNEDIFNSRHSILHSNSNQMYQTIVSNWKYFQTTILNDFKTTSNLIGAIFCLHNFILSESSDEEYYRSYDEDVDMSVFVELEPLAHNATKSDHNIRCKLAELFATK